jgi:hypothetical protein
MCSSWDSLHACASESLLEKMSKETAEEVLQNVLPPFMDGNALGSVPENAGCETRFPCVLKHARDTGYVSTVPVYCVPVYCPTCLGRKCAESTVGSTQLSYAYGSVLRF